MIQPELTANQQQRAAAGFHVKLVGVLTTFRGRSGFGARRVVKRSPAALADDAFPLGLMECMLRARSVLWEDYSPLHKLLVKATLQDQQCWRFTTISRSDRSPRSPSKAASTSHPLRRSKTVGAHFGLTPRRIPSGDSIDFDGHISVIGDAEIRATFTKRRTCS